MPGAQSVRELVTALETDNPNGPPSEAKVRDQGFNFYRRHWTDRWPDGSGVAVPPILRGEEPRPHVDRAALLSSANAVITPADAVDFYVRVCAWGTGTKARMVARRAGALHQPGLAKALLATFETVRRGDARTAYAQLGRGGEHRIKHFGPAFFTKWLYFAAYQEWADEHGPRPLILDARVAKSLGWRTWGWTAEDYVAYLHLVDRVRAAWCPDQTAHVVEYALFQLGGPNKRRLELDSDREVLD